MSVNVQYVGFTAKATVREYSFLVRETAIDSHEITFTILNEAFTSHRLSLQNDRTFVLSNSIASWPIPLTAP